MNNLLKTSSCKLTERDNYMNHQTAENLQARFFAQNAGGESAFHAIYPTYILQIIYT